MTIKNTGHRSLHFDTRAIHQGLKSDGFDGATLPPIYQNAAHYHETAQDLSRTFAGETGDHIYMRLTNPTNQFLENKLCALESGRKAILTSSGMAAINNACMTLLRAGDELVASKSLFMSTFNLFTNIYSKYGIKAVLVDPLDPEKLEKSITGQTRFVYIETITNPGMEIADIRRIANIAHSKGVPLLVDNTLASPWLCRPIELGADIVLHSTTKYLSGHGASLGGLIVDAGNFDWSQPRFEDFAGVVPQAGNLSFITKAWKEAQVNFGTTPAPFHSFLTAVGLNTLGVRMERHMENAMKTASFLKTHSKVKWVNFPGFEDHISHKTAIDQFCSQGFGTMLTFGLENEEACFKCIDRLYMILNLANLGDCKTLIIHPWSTQYITFPKEQREKMADPCLLRLSVGIEHIDDICADLDQALAGV